MQSDANTLTLTFEANPDSVGQARHAVSDFAVEAGALPQQVDAIRLASSEAVTNAVLHAYRDAPGRVYVTAAVVADELWVLIGDDGCGLEALADRPGLGLGLALIAQVSDELAVIPRASGGVEVRMRFDLVRAAGGHGSAEEPNGWRSRMAEARRHGMGDAVSRRRHRWAGRHV